MDWEEGGRRSRILGRLRLSSWAPAAARVVARGRVGMGCNKVAGDEDGPRPGLDSGRLIVLWYEVQLKKVMRIQDKEIGNRYSNAPPSIN